MSKVHATPSFLFWRKQVLTSQRELGLSLLLLASAANAQSFPESPLYDGPFLNAQGHYIDNSDLDGKGYGGSLGGGYRSGRYAVELAGSYSDLSGIHYQGFAIKGLFFPFSSLPTFYGSVGAGGSSVKDVPGVQEFSVTTFEGGLGYLLPMTIGRYQFAWRLDASYRHGIREKKINETRDDIPAPAGFNDLIVGVGLYLPLRFGEEPLADAAQTPAVVPVDTQEPPPDAAAAPAQP